MHAGERSFVNPYTFVPFPERVVRERALGHRPTAAQARERYSGSFTVTWTTRTPLALPEGQGWYGKDGTVSIPGSSAKGAVRSVHEALFAGCPRVVTEDFIPVYRDPVTKHMLDGWSLAVVIEADEHGDPRTVRLCGDEVWVNAVALKKRYPGTLPRTGDVLRLDQRPWHHDGLNRDQLPPARQGVLTGKELTIVPRAAVQLTGKGWTRGRVLLVSDTAARNPIKNQHDERRKPIPANTPISGEKLKETAACFWVTGELTDTVAHFKPRPAPGAQRRAPENALADFERRVEGARDRQKGNPPSGDFAPVTWWKHDAYRPLRLPGQPSANHRDPLVLRQGGGLKPAPDDMEPVAERRVADGRLLVGDVVWVEARPDPSHPHRQLEVVAVKLAAAWRTAAGATKSPSDASGVHSAEGDLNSLGGRLRAKPCTTWEHLCLSCALFGSADVTGDLKGTGQQTSYRGHVRFGSVVGTRLAVGKPVKLAPLSSPRPGVGMFYLDHRTVPATRRSGDMPGRWDSGVDVPVSTAGPEGDGLRQLRGRKFYWHSDPADQVAAIRAAGVTNPVARHLRSKPRDEDDDGGFQTTVRLVEPDQQLRQTITFDGLDRLSLLTLLASFDPARILPPEPGEYAIHLGGGKPFGLGSVQAAIEAESIMISSTADRYGAEAAAGPDLTWTDRDRVNLRKRVGDDVDSLHQAAAQVLGLHGLGEFETRVTYPITVPWGRYASDDFVRSFSYFGNNSGERLADHADRVGRARSYAPLPILASVDDIRPTPIAQDPHA